MMFSFLKTAVATFLAVAMLSAQPAWSYVNKAEDIAGRLAGLALPFTSLVAKSHGDDLYITLPRGKKLAEGVLSKVVNRDGAVAGFGLITAVKEKYAVLRMTVVKEPVTAGESHVIGLKPPVRVLWLNARTEEKAEAEALVNLEEAVRDHGVFDLPPAGVSRHFMENFPITKLENIPVAEFEKLAATTRADIIALVEAESAAEGLNISITLLTPWGERLLTIKETWETEKLITAKQPEPTEDEAVEETPTPEEERQAGAQSFLKERWKGVIAQPATAGDVLLSYREKLKWKKHKVEGAALSGASFKDGEGADELLAIAFENKLVIYHANKDGMKKIEELKAPSGLSLLSVLARDTDGDGKDEIFVNAYKDSSLTSFVMGKTPKGHEIVIKNVPYYFSASSDGALLAQKGEEGMRFITGEVYTVTRTADKLEFIPAFTLKGAEIPIGINRVDLDGDRLLEITGLSPKGRLLIFDQSGELVWKGADFGVTGRAARISQGRGGTSSTPVPPRVLAVEGTTLVTAGAEFKPGGIFESAGLEKGFVRFIKIEEKKYRIEDSIRGVEGWISDLIDYSSDSRQARTFGYIRVYSGVISDESEIVIPVE